jgi:hypothetical protein
MYLYYVYAYLRKSDGTPYYIGKGKNQRAYDKHPGLSVPNDRSKIVFLETNLSDVGACAIERRMIGWYGRKDLETGILRNKTDGGDGSVGVKMSEETKDKIRIASTGRKHTEKSKSIMSAKKIGNKNGINSPGNTGMQHTEDQKRKIAESGTGRIWSEESKTKLSNSLKGKNKGRKFTEEHKLKISAARKGKKIIMTEKRILADAARKGILKPTSECPFCHRSFSPSTMALWHGNKCKSK